MPFKKYRNVLLKYMSENQIEDLSKRWSEPHRVYHTEYHLSYMLNLIEQEKSNDILYDVYILSAFFHDAVYQLGAGTNEEDSVDYMKTVIGQHNISKDVEKFIMITDNRNPNWDDYGFDFWRYDNYTIFEAPFEELVTNEKKIFKEFQKLDYAEYKQNRIDFINQPHPYDFDMDIKLNAFGDYIKQRVPLVGVYAGSFNPFHKGHYNVLLKSENIFDKVIVAFGHNPEKPKSDIVVPETIKNRQIEFYDGLLPDFISKIEKSGVKATLIRGLRNGADLDYESNQLAFMEDFKPDIKVVYLPCDKEFEHISSTAIRNLNKIKPGLGDKYIVK